MGVEVLQAAILTAMAACFTTSAVAAVLTTRRGANLTNLSLAAAVAGLALLTARLAIAGLRSWWVVALVTIFLAVAWLRRR